MKFKHFLLLTALILISIVFLQNLEIVEYRFLFWFLALPKALFALIYALSGILIWLIFKKLFTKKHHDNDFE